jgi:hypothetical protein
MAKTYFGTGLMTKIYLGAVEIAKVYYGTALVFVNSVVPPSPSPDLVQQVYTDFNLNLQVYQKPDNNVYTDFDISLQVIKKV